MKRILWIVGVVGMFSVYGHAASLPPDTEKIAAVQAGTLSEAQASWWGFNETDATENLQAALDSGVKKLTVDCVQGKPWVVQSLQVTRDNMEIRLAKGVEIVARAGAFQKKGATLLTVRGRKNITICAETPRAGTLRMRKADYQKPPYVPSEWRHAVSLLSSEQITIEGLDILASGGDGIYLGVAGNQGTCRNIVIRNVVCDDNHRQGISVISAENLLIEDTRMSNTCGTAPEAGIDFEPNQEREKLVNCVLRNCVCEGNASWGIAFYLPNLTRRSGDVDVTIENCIVRNNRAGGVCATASNVEDLSLTGQIRLRDCQLENQPEGLRVYALAAGACRFAMENCVFKNCSSDSNGGPSGKTVVTLYALSKSELPFGSFVFQNVQIHDEHCTSFEGERPFFRFVDDAQNGIGAKDCRADFQFTHGGQTESIIRTAEWFQQTYPPANRRKIPSIPIEPKTLKPWKPNASPTALSKIRCRRNVSFWRFAKKGEEITFSLRQTPVSTYPMSRQPVVCTSPSGKKTDLAPTQFDRDTDYRWIAEEDGVYQIYADAGSGAIRLTASNGPMVVDAQKSLNVVHSGGESVYFYVPPETPEFGIRVHGEGEERVQVTLWDPNGKTVWQQDDLSATVFFTTDENVPPPAGIWRLQIDRPSHGVLEDCGIQLYGIPSLFAFHPEGVWTPETFELSTRTTRVRLEVAEKRLFLRTLQGAAGWNWATPAMEIPFPERLNDEPVTWQFQTCERRENGLRFHFTSADGRFGLDSDWTVEEPNGAGPVTFQQTLTNHSSEPMRMAYSDLFSCRGTLALADGTRLWRFNRGRVNDGTDPLFNHAVQVTPLMADQQVDSRVENMCNVATGILPFQVLDAGEHGLYFGYEWSFGLLRISTAKDARKAALSAQLYDQGTITRGPGEAFTCPAFFFGVYSGDADDGANEMKRWFWKHHITRSLYENADEPRVEICHGGNETNVQDLYRTIPDIRDYVQVLKIDYDWTVPPGTPPRANIPQEDTWLPDPQKYPNGIRNFWAMQRDEPQGRRMYLSLYFADTFQGVDLATEAGRRKQLVALQERFRPDAQNRWGFDYWRSDFNVERPYDYDSHAGLLWILDEMIRFHPDFRYEHCSGAGSLKDFTTLRRMAFMTTEDSALPLNHRMTHYANSYMICPVQLKADLNLGFTSRNCGAIQRPEHERFDSTQPEYLKYAYRTGMLGAMMVSAGAWTPEHAEIARTHWKLYAERVRPILRNTCVYHILPQPEGWDWADWDGLEYYQPELQKGMVLLFKENTTAPNERTIRLKGLESTAKYRVTFADRTHLDGVFTGAELMEKGLFLNGMTEQFDSEIVWLEKVSF